MTDPHAREIPPLEYLELAVDGRQVSASLTRFPALTWDDFLDLDAEREAIVTFVRDCQQVAREYRASHGALRRAMSDLGTVGVVANALGVAPADLLAGGTDHPGGIW